jgi:hypothetical protein
VSGYRKVSGLLVVDYDQRDFLGLQGRLKILMEAVFHRVNEDFGSGRNDLVGGFLSHGYGGKPMTRSRVSRNDFITFS